MPRQTIKELREHHGLTQRKLAEKLNISERRYQNWEKKNRDDKYYYIKTILLDEIEVQPY